MWRAVYPSASGGFAVLAIILIAATVLSRVGTSFGEALYVSMLGWVALSYAATAWRLRRGR